MELLNTLTDSHGLPALFCLSFLAATILPIGSEWLLVLLVIQGRSPVYVVMTASIGNFLGACTTYCLGLWGSDFLVRSVLRTTEKQMKRAQRLYKKFGTWSLLLSWLPVIGDPLCLLAGLFKVGFQRFSFLVFIGKFARYATLAILTLKGTGA